jgi:hypothetical protein
MNYSCQSISYKCDKTFPVWQQVFWFPNTEIFLIPYHILSLYSSPHVAVSSLSSLSHCGFLEVLILCIQLFSYKLCPTVSSYKFSPCSNSERPCLVKGHAMMAVCFVQLINSSPANVGTCWYIHRIQCFCHNWAQIVSYFISNTCG